MTAAEAAALIKNGENIALSGFTPSGAAKAVTKELARLPSPNTRQAANSKWASSPVPQQDRAPMVTSPMHRPSATAHLTPQTLTSAST